MSKELFSSDPEAQAVALRLEGVESLRPEYANIIHLNFDSDAFQLVFSRFTQPVAATEEEKQETLRRGTYPIPAVARILLPVTVARQLRDLLEAQIERYDSLLSEIGAGTSADRDQKPGET